MRTQEEGYRGCCGSEEERRSERHREERDCGSRRGEFGGWRHGFRGRGGPMRFFGAGDLRYVILQLISEKPSHGYEIIKSIQERLGGGYAPSPGVVYPMLTMLGGVGHAAVVADGAGEL